MTPENEARRILNLCKGDMLQALAILERQLAVLQTRAQIMMSLAGVVVTVTGFSGRLIAGHDRVAQISIVLGVAFVLLSAVWMYVHVMGIRWVTQGLDEDPQVALESVIVRRNKKTVAYQRGGILLCVGFVLYCIALCLLLLNPEPVHLPVR